LDDLNWGYLPENGMETASAEHLLPPPVAPTKASSGWLETFYAT
jgi:hypothetical protein